MNKAVIVAEETLGNFSTTLDESTRGKEVNSIFKVSLPGCGIFPDLLK